ncbi:MAG: hypothetical protein P4L65_10035 [Legionella sp.]|nr:hypothetical protein [Legionella sp.]
MEYNSKEIMQLTNPYEVLSKHDLAPYQPILDSLATKDKITLAVKMVSGCPKDKLKEFKLKFNALNTFAANEEETFYSVLQGAYQVKSIMCAALNDNNKNPHRFLLEEFNPDLLNRFSELALSTIGFNTAFLAEQMALSTPAEQRNKVASNTEMVFSGSDLAQKINQAFTLRRNIENQLLGDLPEQFFTSPDFNPRLYPLFSNLFDIVEGQIEAIGLKLSQLSDVKTKEKVIECIDQLHTEGHDEVNPFKRIADVMHPPRISDKVSASNNPNTLFGDSKQQKQKSKSDDKEYKNVPCCTIL